MAGWSMAADEDEDAVDFSKTPKSFDLNKSPGAVSYSDSAVEKSVNELVSLFRSLLESFLVEFSPPPFPPVTSDGISIDLFSLFINVSHRGGFRAVSENAAWDEVGHESGLGFDNIVSAKFIYVKYLAALARWLNRVVAGDSSVELPGISEDLIRRLRDFVSQVKREYELSKGTASREVGAEFKWFISRTKRRYVDNESVKVKTSDKKLEKVMMLDSGNKDCSSPGKRKRECSLETLKWLIEAAKDPCDISIGSLPDRSKWECYGSEEPWKQLLLFRASRTNSDPACQKIWQKTQKMLPSLYQDSAGPSYNLRERLSFDDERKAGKGKISSEDGSASDGSDDEDESWALVGSEFQAEVPEWTGITSESDSKWLGTVIWPLIKEQNNNNRLIERDPIGKGRQDPCGCQNPGSVDCVRFHIKAKQEKLKLELGSAFYMWCFDTMGEGNLQYWTDSELKKVVSLMPTPPTLIPSFFDEVKNVLPSKRRGKIVSYFYNVMLLQFRANQSRVTPDEIDSDTDTQYKLANLEANTSQKPVLLTPKKKRRR